MPIDRELSESKSLFPTLCQVPAQAIGVPYVVSYSTVPIALKTRRVYSERPDNNTVTK